MSTIRNVKQVDNGTTISLSADTQVVFDAALTDGFRVHFVTTTDDVFSFKSSVSEFVNASGTSTRALSLGGQTGSSFTITYRGKYDKFYLSSGTVVAGSSVDLTAVKNDVSFLKDTLTANAVEITALKAKSDKVPKVSTDNTGKVIGLLRPDGTPFLIISPNPPDNSDGTPDGTIYIQTV